ncbi:MAG: hypothetical protein NT056_06400 [Proteobacteria bacterium]|nr:hypothetical protein [Pseudomonadota bacterium]
MNQGGNEIKQKFEERKRRVEAAIRLETPDRVPFTTMVYSFAARFAGISVHDYIFNPRENRRVHRIFNQEFEPDMNYLPATNLHPLMVALAQPCPVRLPGRELPPDESWQCFEEPLMTVEDYEYIIRKGMPLFMRRFLPKIRPQFIRPGISGLPGRLKILGLSISAITTAIASIRDAGKMGFPTFLGGGFESPFCMISLARSLKEFSRDIHQRPETVSRAIQRSVPSLVRVAKFMSRISGVPRVLIGFHREAFLSPRQFRELALPEIREITSLLSRAGVVTVLHCDSDWTPHLEALQELPEKSCVLEFDGATDIFKAKKTIGKRLCIKGDVPARILALGTKDQVLDYCRKLIEEVGEGGGFILASGCEIPPDAKPENVAAMREAVEKYGKY